MFQMSEVFTKKMNDICHTPPPLSGYEGAKKMRKMTWAPIKPVRVPKYEPSDCEKEVISSALEIDFGIGGEHYLSSNFNLPPPVVSLHPPVSVRKLSFETSNQDVAFLQTMGWDMTQIQDALSKI